MSRAFQVGFDLDPETYTMTPIGEYSIVYVGDIAREYVEQGVGSAGQTLNRACLSYNAGDVL